MPIAGHTPPGPHDQDDARHNRALTVPLGDGAQMSFPFNYWLWRLRYAEDRTPENVCDDRMLAAGVLESYRYLVMECSKEEAWKRIKAIRTAVADYPETE